MWSEFLDEEAQETLAEYGYWIQDFYLKGTKNREKRKVPGAKIIAINT
jgi:hypothetical protein